MNIKKKKKSGHWKGSNVFMYTPRCWDIGLYAAVSPCSKSSSVWSHRIWNSPVSTVLTASLSWTPVPLPPILQCSHERVTVDSLASAHPFIAPFHLTNTLPWSVRSWHHLRVWYCRGLSDTKASSFVLRLVMGHYRFSNPNWPDRRETIHGIELFQKRAPRWDT